MNKSTRAPSTSCNRRLFGLASGYKAHLILLGFASFLGAVVIVLQMTSLGRIIDGAFLGHLRLSQLWTPFTWLIAAICLRAVTVWLGSTVAQEIAIRVKQELRTRLFAHLIDLGPLFTQREKTGELVACCAEGVERVDAWYASFLPHGLAMAIVPLSLALFVTWIDWPSGIVLMLTGPLIPVFMVLIGLTAKQKIDRQWSTLQRMSGHFLDVLQGLPTLHLLGRSDLEAANIRRVSEDFRRRTMQVLYVAFLSGLVLELAASISTALVAVEIGVRLIEGLINFQTGLVILLLAPEFYLPFRLFGASHHAGMEGAAAGQRIFEILDQGKAGGDELPLGPDRSNGDMRLSRPTSAGSPLPVPAVHVIFDGVEYQYPETHAPALRGVSFELAPGRLYLLTGHSGAGKSTAIKLLLQLVQPTGGAILINDRPLNRIPPAIWRTQISFVPQKPHFFEGSILDNLRIANRDALLEEVRMAARLAEADDFILDLPEGYGARMSEAAKRFSGGERQRLAIARAFLKPGSLLLFDEPVSHLDAETAAKLQRALIRLARHRTTMIVAHHGFASSAADEIFVLSRGQLRRHGRAVEGAIL